LRSLLFRVSCLQFASACHSFNMLSIRPFFPHTRCPFTLSQDASGLGPLFSARVLLFTIYSQSGRPSDAPGRARGHHCPPQIPQDSYSVDTGSDRVKIHSVHESHSQQSDDGSLLYDIFVRPFLSLYCGRRLRECFHGPVPPVAYAKS
jgi:hypothetical protein